MSKNIPELFSKVLFATFYVLLLVELFSIVHNSSALLLIIFTAVPFFLITLFSPFWGLWSFVAAIPVLNGFLLMKGIGDVSFAFAGVYLAWFPRQLLKNTRLQPTSLAAFCGNLLAVIVFVNLFLVLVRIADSPLPSQLWLDWFTFFPLVNQQDNLWQINAALIVLKGLFLFRMLEIELKDKNSWLVFTKTIYLQAISIAGFSIYQVITSKMKGVDYISVSYPFNDTHSYGSYAVLLLAIFAYYFLHSTRKSKAYGDNQSDSTVEKKRNLINSFDTAKIAGICCRWTSRKSVNGVLAALFLFFCIYSFSRITWLTMSLVVFFLLATAIKNKKLIISLGVIVAVSFIIGSMTAPKLLKSKDPSLYRIGTFLNVENIAEDRNLLIRFELWKRALKMVRDYPLTGVGVGNFFRNQAHYKNISLGKCDIENAHNYYVQLFAELGFPGLLLFLAILFSLYCRQCIVGRENNKFSSQGILVNPFLWGLGAYLLTMLTGHPLLLSNQQFLFWAVVAMISQGQVLHPSGTKNIEYADKHLTRIGVFTCFLFVLGCGFNLYNKGPWTIPREYGLYSTEYWGVEKMRWMAGKAGYYLPEGTKYLDFKVVVQPFNSQPPDGLTLAISVNDAIVDKVRFMDGGSRILHYDLSTVNNRDIKVNLEVSRVFRPAHIGLNNDFRTLGVTLGFDAKRRVPSTVFGLLELR